MEPYLQQLQAAAALYVPRVVLALLTLIIGFWLIHYFMKLLTTVMTRRHVDATVIPFLRSIIEVVLKIVLVISVAGMFGVETTSFVALIGGAGLAIGLALQGSLGHFASGVMLLVFRPYRVGDLVTVAGFTGEVTEIQVFNTVLKTLDNRRIIIPNGAVTAGPITNISGQGTIRVDMQFSVSGSEDIDKVRAVVQQVADASPLILKDPATDILVNSQEIGITKFDVRPWCLSANYWDVYYYMQEHIKRQFVAQGVEAPTPAMNVMVSNK